MEKERTEREPEPILYSVQYRARARNRPERKGKGDWLSLLSGKVLGFGSGDLRIEIGRANWEWYVRCLCRRCCAVQYRLSRSAAHLQCSAAQAFLLSSPLL